MSPNAYECPSFRFYTGAEQVYRCGKCRSQKAHLCVLDIGYSVVFKGGVSGSSTLTKWRKSFHQSLTDMKRLSFRGLWMLNVST